MDREKAIQILKRCEAESYCSHYKQHCCCIGCGQREALDLAIEALSDMSEEEVDYCNNCPYISYNEDCISRQDVIEAVRLATAEKRTLGRGDILDILYSTPLVTPPKRVVAQISVDIEELIERIKEEYKIMDKVGKWERQYCYQEWKCSECEYEIDGKTNYCPNCGAKMKRKDNE